MDTIREFLRKNLAPAAPPVEAIRHKDFVPELRSVDDAKRTITFVASTEAQDRYGDIVRVKGWKTANYMKNPIFLWGHRSQDPPIGKCVELNIETSPKPALVQKIQFATKEQYPFADTIYQLYKGGFMNAVSVGFIPLERPTPIEDENGRMSGYEFTSQELLELSAVPIPANPEAMARAVNSGIVSHAAAVKIFDSPLLGEAPPPARLPVHIARRILKEEAARCGKEPYPCGDSEAISRATCICEYYEIFRIFTEVQIYLAVNGYPKQLQDEYAAICASLAPNDKPADELDEFFKGISEPPPAALNAWLDSLAGS